MMTTIKNSSNSNCDAIEAQNPLVSETKNGYKRAPMIVNPVDLAPSKKKLIIIKTKLKIVKNSAGSKSVK